MVSHFYIDTTGKQLHLDSKKLVIYCKRKDAISVNIPAIRIIIPINTARIMPFITRLNMIANTSMTVRMPPIIFKSELLVPENPLMKRQKPFMAAHKPIRNKYQFFEIEFPRFNCLLVSKY